MDLNQRVKRRSGTPWSAWRRWSNALFSYGMGNKCHGLDGIFNDGRHKQNIYRNVYGFHFGGLLESWSLYLGENPGTSWRAWFQNKLGIDKRRPGSDSISPKKCRTHKRLGRCSDFG